MLSNTIFAIATIAVTAMAVPMQGTSYEVVKRNSPPTTPAQTCGNNLTAKCCNSVVKQILDLIPVNVGIDCVTLVGTVACTQQVACCESGNQVGLVNVGNVCPILL